MSKATSSEQGPEGAGLPRATQAVWLQLPRNTCPRACPRPGAARFTLASASLPAQRRRNGLLSNAPWSQCSALRKFWGSARLPPLRHWFTFARLSCPCLHFTALRSGPCRPAAHSPMLLSSLETRAFEQLCSLLDLSPVLTPLRLSFFHSNVNNKTVMNILVQTAFPTC